MNDGFLSQEEINSLLNDDSDKKEEKSEDNIENKSVEENAETKGPKEDLSEIEGDLLGEIGNISMGSASTALSTIINQQVNITTPVVSVTTLNELKNTFEVPNIALEVKYTSGIVGENLLVMRIPDAAVIASLMMGSDGKVDSKTELSEIEISAVSEAMNQMIGSAATSMATMFGREVNISPPDSRIWDDLTSPLTSGIDENETIVKVSFSLTIGDLVDSHIMQLLPIKTARKIVGIMMGNDTQEVTTTAPAASKVEQPMEKKQPVEQPKQQPVSNMAPPTESYTPIQQPIAQPKPIEVQQAQFQPLQQQPMGAPMPKNIDLIMDVPLEVSVVLGRARLNIKEILNLGTGSLIELNKLAEEPVEILVNGKAVAQGEVVVIDENFGVRITSIVNKEQKIRSLGR